VQRTYAVILDTGEEAVACLTAFAKEHRLSASQFTALGAFRDCVLGYFDWEKKDYARIPIDEQVEVLALVGDIALND
jgi:predicted DNA-binding protein with PD1-like motif